MNKGITFEIVEKIGAISTTKANGFTKEINIVSWNGNAPKIDIREWDADHIRMSRGVTLTEEEAMNMYNALKGRYE